MKTEAVIVITDEVRILQLLSIGVSIGVSIGGAEVGLFSIKRKYRKSKTIILV